MPPHLILEFKADRETREVAQKIIPTGAESLYFRIIDTDSGKITEIQADAKNVRHTERIPSWGETKIASETLNRPIVGDTVEAKVHEVVRAERDKLKAQLDETKADLIVKNETVVKLSAKVEEYESNDVKEGRDILASALDSYLEELAASMDFSRYEKGKRVYRRLTGQKWVDDGSDDEEGDLST